MGSEQSIHDAAFNRSLRPERRMSVSDWADQHRILPGSTSAEPGPWRTARTPYLREIMDQLGPDSKAERVVFMKGAQIGGTECGNNWLGYIIHHCPGPILMVMPTLDNAKETSRIRISPMIEACPILRERVFDVRTKDGGNSLFMKQFEGGFLGLTGANASAGLRSKPIRYLFTDEVDEYPADVGGQGDPLALAVKRTSTFANRKIYMCSTPTVKGASRVERLFDESDQRRYMVPCPECGAEQPIEWQQIKWDKGEDGAAIPETVRLECVTCGHQIPETAKTWMLEHGRWKAQADGDGQTVGFHLNALYSPLGWYSWEQAVRDFIKAKKAPELLRTFINTVLGETWEEDSEQADSETLRQRQTEFGPDNIPQGVVMITAGVDVQDDRLEALVVGWGRANESWIIERRVVTGSPGLASTWATIDDHLARVYLHPSGAKLPIGRACVDTGGHHTTDAYRFCKTRFPQVAAIKGKGDYGRPLVTRATWQGKGATRVRLFTVGVDGAKDTIFARYKIATPGPGFIHYSATLPDDTFDQLTAERRILERNQRTGAVKYSWKTYGRNEALDCYVYAMAALELSGARLDSLADRMEATPEPVADEHDDKPKPKRARRRPPKTGWFG